MMSINPPQSFDWTVRNLHKAFNEWLEEVNLFFLNFRNLKGRVEIVSPKLQMLKRKKDHRGKKGQQIYKTLTIKNAKRLKKNLKWLSKHSRTTANL